MADTQVQHYVPKFLLRRFGSGKKDHVQVFDKHTGRKFSSAARRIAAQKALYDFEFKGSKVTLEPGLSALETRAAKRIEAITRDRKLHVLDPVERGELSAFLAVQMVRTPALWEMTRGTFERMEAWAREHGMRDEWFKPPEELGTRENAEKAMIAKTIHNAPKDLGPSLAKKDWVLLQTDRQHPYLIGDHPLTMHNMVDRSPRGNLGLEVEGIEIYFPLSPQMGLALWCPSHRKLLADGIPAFRRSMTRRLG
jgi:hypothetical protein